MVKKQTGFSAIESLIFIVIISVIGAIAFKIYDDRHSQQKKDATINTYTNKIPVGWKKFTETGTNFTFGYPSDWGKLEPSESGSSSLFRATTSVTDNTNNLTGELEFLVFHNKESYTISLGVDSPLVGARFSNGSLKWIIAASSTSPGYADYKDGDRLNLTPDKINNLDVYNFGYAEKGCSINRWVVELKKEFIEISLPRLCVNKDSNTSEVEEQLKYGKLSEKIVKTFTVNSN